MDFLVSFPSGNVEFCYKNNLESLFNNISGSDYIIITNEHIKRLYPNLFLNHKNIVIPAGEYTKDLQTIISTTKELLALGASRKTTLIGIGGGVITDITGFLASVYFRGIEVYFVPTSLLSMVDASIGGKNGVNFENAKNIIGSFYHPRCIFFYYGFLKTLPLQEWSNGFAEIIKYSFLFDIELYVSLTKTYISFYQEDYNELDTVISKCIKHKNKVVQEDEREKGQRKLLNFGHTYGHALENLYQLPHGYAVSIGMILACRLSEKILGLDPGITEKLTKILEQYFLPVRIKYKTQEVMQLLSKDKKKNNNGIDFILIKNIGHPVIKNIEFDIIERNLAEYENIN